MVARCGEDVVPEVGNAVVDSGLDAVGRVVDVFGPVGRPYAVVEWERGVEPGEKLYLRD